MQIARRVIPEIPGKDSTIKENALAEKLRKAFHNREGVKVTRQIKEADRRLSVLDKSITTEKMVRAIVAAEYRETMDVTTEEIRPLSSLDQCGFCV